MPITLTCADYPRLFPLAAGIVQAEGIDLRLILGEGGSWAKRADMLGRALADPGVQGGEGSMARQLRRIEAGDRSFVALPAFPLRNLTARDIYVRKDGPIHRAADLNGCRVGCYSWSASGSIWYRHMLRFLGVAPDSMQWCIGTIDTPEWAVAETGLPDNVHTAPGGRPLARMLLDGELDALLSPPRPQDFHPGEGPIVRLFPDFRAVEADYARAFRIWPPQHLILLRREAWLADRSIAHAITDAFERNNAVFAQTQRSFPYATPWAEADVEASDTLLGEDAHAEGLERNRGAMEIFCQQALEAGITRRLVSVDDYFAEYLDS